jgi:hypothetical protein
LWILLSITVVSGCRMALRHASQHSNPRALATGGARSSGQCPVRALTGHPVERLRRPRGRARDARNRRRAAQQVMPSSPGAADFSGSCEWVYGGPEDLAAPRLAGPGSRSSFAAPPKATTALMSELWPWLIRLAWQDPCYSFPPERQGRTVCAVVTG